MVTADATVMGLRLSWSAVCDAGVRRGSNEDSILAAPGFFAVADGMGGHDAGATASSIAVERLRDVSNSDPQVQASMLPLALERAQGAIRALAAGRTVGSTLTGLMLMDMGRRPAWLVCHIGDSRCYRLRRGVLEQVTGDHTLVAGLVQAGALSPQQARRHPDRSVLTRAIGTPDALPADYWILDPSPDERFVLCSDGLSDEVSDTEICGIVTAADSARAAAHRLLTLSLERGGRDNISAVVVFCHGYAAEAAGRHHGFDDDTAPRRASPSPPGHGDAHIPRETAGVSGAGPAGGSGADRILPSFAGSAAGPPSPAPSRPPAVPPHRTQSKPIITEVPL